MKTLSVGDMFNFELAMIDSKYDNNIHVLGSWTGSDYEIIGPDGIASFLASLEYQGTFLSQYQKIYKIVSQTEYK